MKINKGIVRNINKKLIAGLLTVTLMTPLVGCSYSSIDDVDYVRDKNGYISGIDGKVTYKNLFDCDFVKVYNNITDENYYTIRLFDYVDGKSYDLFTRQNLDNNEVFKIERLDAVYTWINALGMTKDSYTEEELRELLNKFIEKQKEKDKQLVKE